MERKAARVLKAEGFANSKQRHERSLAMRYRGQSFELEIPAGNRDVTKSFHRAHRDRYGYAQDSEVEIVSARLRSLGLVEELPRQSIARSKQRRTAQPSHKHTVSVNGKKLSVGVYKREELPASIRLQAPCIVTEYSATTLIPDRAEVRIDTRGNLIINV